MIYEGVALAMREAWLDGHDGLVALLDIPPHDDGAKLAQLSTCALAIRAALYAAGSRHKLFAQPYRPGHAMSDLWEILGAVPWGPIIEPGNGVYVVAKGEHVALGSFSGTNDVGYMIGFEAGQTDRRGRQIVQPCMYRFSRVGDELRHARRCPTENRGSVQFVPIR